MNSSHQPPWGSKARINRAGEAIRQSKPANVH
jgi:hypothetical protein